MAEIHDRPTIPDDAPTSPETPSAKGRRIVARRATPGRWCDTSTRLSRPAAVELLRQGYKGVGRYVPLAGNALGADITADELAMLVLDVGLEVVLVQHVRGFPPHNPLWRPGEHDAQADAAAAIAAARVAGYPDGAHIFEDLEAVDGSVGETMGYCVRWGHTMASSGYLAGLYVGYATPLSPADLYSLPDVHCYWADGPQRTVAERGTAIVQGRSLKASGALPPLDEDLVRLDARGDVPVVAAAG
jgi:Domain of unknown function (DUF1906)